MINLETALNKAKEYLKCTEVGKILEAPGYWIIYKRTEEIEVGGYGALVSMDTGEIKSFILPSEENFELLDKSKEINMQDKE